MLAHTLNLTVCSWKGSQLLSALDIACNLVSRPAIAFHNRKIFNHLRYQWATVHYVRISSACSACCLSSAISALYAETPSAKMNSALCVLLLSVSLALHHEEQLQSQGDRANIEWSLCQWWWAFIAPAAPPDYAQHKCASMLCINKCGYLLDLCHCFYFYRFTIQWSLINLFKGRWSAGISMVILNVNFERHHHWYGHETYPWRSSIIYKEN